METLDNYSVEAFNKCVEIILPVVSKANSDGITINNPTILRLVSEQYYIVEDYDLLPKEHKIAYSILKKFAIDLNNNGYLTFGSKEIEM